MYEFTRHPLTMISSDGISVDQLDMQKHPPVVKYNLKTLLVKFDFSSTGTSTSIDASDKATTDNRRAIEWVKHLIDNSRKCPQFKLSYTAAMTLPLDKVLVPFLCSLDIKPDGAVLLQCSTRREGIIVCLTFCLISLE